jgi:hypothetical protein
MRPAFSSTQHAAAFVLLLLFFLAAPELSALKLLPQPNESYSSESTRWENFPWVQKFIYEETNDIDIAFVGSSHLGHDIDAQRIEQELDRRLGRKSVVRTIYFRGGGFDALYLFTRDLLAHRRVNTLVFYDEASGITPGEANESTPHWFRFTDDREMLSGLPLNAQAVYYFAAVIGMPRILLEQLTPNLPRNPHISDLNYTWNEPGMAADPEETLGNARIRQSYDIARGIINDPLFSPYIPQTGVTTNDVYTYGPATKSNFEFSNRPLPELPIIFAQKFGALAKAHGCQLIELHPPVLAEKDSPVITESRNWSDLLQMDVTMIGIPPRRLFAGLSDSDLGQLFYDPVHFNENGQSYFTALVAPAILDAYEKQIRH